MTTVADWEGATGDSWGDMYQATDRAFAALTQLMLERLVSIPGDSILDIGCGAGELAIALAETRPSARVIGVDVSPPLVDVARSRVRDAANPAFELADAATWQGQGFTPDLLVSRHGVMFFDDPVAAFAHLLDQSAPSASLLFSCFRDPPGNEWAAGPVRLLDLPGGGDPDAPGPFAFSDDARVRSILAQSGWRGITAEPVDFPFLVGSGADPVGAGIVFLQRIGPAARALAAMEPAAREKALRKIERWLHDAQQGDIVAFPARAWIVTARKPEGFPADRAIRSH